MLLTARNLSKSFPGVRALDGVSLDLAAGEGLGLIGENGAGKSTLIKILGGIYRPDAGTLTIHGRPTTFRSAHDSFAAGIAVIHQELNLADNLSVAENLFLGRQPRHPTPLLARLGIRDRRALRTGAAAALLGVGLDVDPDAPLGRLGPGQKQLVEIAKALSRDARILIFDEPTSSLTARETGTLLDRIDALKAAGIAVLYVSHRLHEIARPADRVQVLRDGRTAGFLAGADIHHGAMVRLMSGQGAVATVRRRSPPTLYGTALEVRGLDLRRPQRRDRAEPDPAGDPDGPRFDLRRGEVVGLGGLLGSGRSATLRALYGVAPRHGTLRIDGREAVIRTPRDAIRAGICLVPEERKAHGLVLELEVAANLTLPTLDRHAVRGRIDRQRVTRAANHQIERLSIRPADGHARTAHMSGGNQQKVVLGKWLAAGGSTLLLDEPTRGVDVAGKGDIHRLIGRLAASGLAVLVASSDSEELCALCDRVLVLTRGRLAGVLHGDDITEANLLALATGATS